MAESTQDRANALVSVMGSVNDKTEATQQQAIAAVLGQPTQRTTNWLWRAVVSGLLVVLVIALGGIIGLVGSGHSADTVVTVFSATLTGLIGLFVPSPVDKGTGNGGGATK